jgi:bacteriocin-like protein
MEEEKKRTSMKELDDAQLEQVSGGIKTTTHTRPI